MVSLERKVIVVTGSSGLLGNRLIERLKSMGAEAVGLDINIKNQSDHEFYVDISDEHSVNTSVQRIIKKFGKIDGWVNNAYPRTSDWGNKFEDIEVDSWRKNVDDHLNGYFICCKAVLEQMKNQKYGSLINMSSIYGLLGPDFSVYGDTGMTMPAAYAAIKGGLNNLTRYLASYYGPHNIRVNTISPGGVFDNQPSQFVEKYNKRVPMRRMATTEDIMPSIIFLLSEEASYITGHNLVVDGGWTII